MFLNADDDPARRRGEVVLQVRQIVLPKGKDVGSYEVRSSLDVDHDFAREDLAFEELDVIRCHDRFPGRFLLVLHCFFDLTEGELQYRALLSVRLVLGVEIRELAPERIVGILLEPFLDQ